MATFLLTVVLPGCGRDSRQEITGDVTLDGQPLADGVIEFRPVDGAGPSAGALIIDGHYQVKVMPGRTTVVIRAFRENGQIHANPGDAESPMIPARKEIMLEQFTEASPTTVDVPAQGDLDFDLRSRP